MNAKYLRLPVVLAGAVLLVSSTFAQEVTAPSTTNRIVSWLSGRSLPHIDTAQAEAYVQKQQRRPESLLAAWQASNDRAFLREAMEKHPHDRRVALAAAFQPGSTKATGDAVEPRQRLDAFKKAAPANALADYLSAHDYFKTGQTELAEKEVRAGASKPMSDYALEFIENTQEAYQSAGYSEAEALALAMGSLLMPHLAQLRDLGAQLTGRAEHYRASGDTASADKMLHAVRSIGAQLDETNSLTILQSLVGVRIQQQALEAFEPGTLIGNSTVEAEGNRLLNRRNELRALANSFDRLFRKMSDREIGDHFELQKRIGEESADRQALAKRAGD